jgi:hypothetical protein
MLRALRRGLEGEFRHGAGVGYSGWSSYELVDAEHAMLTAGMDILPEALSTVVSEATSVLRRLRDRGLDLVELRDDLDDELRRLTKEPAEHWLPSWRLATCCSGAHRQTAIGWRPRSTTSGEPR